MTYKVERSEEFTAAFSEAVDYVCNTLCSPRAAKAILDEMDHQIDLLSEQPSWFPVDRLMSERFGIDIYRASVRSYAVFYMISEPTKTVHLITFRHRAQDISTFIDRELHEN